MQTMSNGPLWRPRPWDVASTAVIALLLAGCSAGTTKAGSTSPAASGTVRLRFAAGEPQVYDTAFGRDLAALSGGRVTVETVSYTWSTAVDVQIVKDLRAGKLDVADVASRAWLDQGVDGFTPYQAPFLVTSRSLLDQAVQTPVAAGALKSLDAIGVTGLALVPRGVRYVVSTRPLRSPADFAGATIGLYADPLGGDVITALGAKVGAANGMAALNALKAGKLTGVEADVQVATTNGYLSAAPYVLTGAPLYAKTTTFVASTAKLNGLGQQAAAWVRQAAEQAAGEASKDLGDRPAWAGACAAGAKPVPLTGAELDALRAAEEGVYRRIGATPGPTLTFDRIGALATQVPRNDPWTACQGPPAESTTGPLDGRYTVHVTPAQVQAAGSCPICGNDGDYTIVIHDGRYAILHPTPPDADPNEPSTAFVASWGRDDPGEVGSIVITGNRALIRPETNLQFIPGGDPSAVYSFTAFRGTLRWTAVSGNIWTELFTGNPWARAG